MTPLTPERLAALEPLLKLADTDVQDFEESGRRMSKKHQVKKIGEGSYADVFELTPIDREETISFAEQGGAVIKVIPFRVDLGKNDTIEEQEDDTHPSERSKQDDMPTMASVANEVRLLQALNPLHGYVQCRHVRIVSGKYPANLLDAFKEYKATATDAVNVNPAEAYHPNQLYAVVEMDNVGTPICRLKNISAFQAFDIFWSTAIILAHAEREIEFEHRDLHDANICFKPKVWKGPIDVEQALVEEMTTKPLVRLGLSNLKLTIIDYTISRAKIGGEEDGLVVFDPIEHWERDDIVYDDDDQIVNLQYRTYHRVRELAMAAEAMARAQAELEDTEYVAVEKYSRHLPKSNVLWLAYLVSCLLAKRGVGRAAFVPGSSRAAKELQKDLWGVLEWVKRSIVDSSTTSLTTSAVALVALAAEDGVFLKPEDMAAFEASMAD
jgi:serine/threonine-protein kinase haspin